LRSAYSRLHESLQEVLSNRLGWDMLRDVQEDAYQAVSAGDDVLVIAPTAGGKTEAALIPVLDRILKDGCQGISCIYISPLKALINDQEERFSSFCIPTGLDLLKWHGDVPRGDRRWKDGEAPHFLMITPESLEVLMGERNLAEDLSRVRFVIIDELHAFVESERGVHLRVLLDRIDALADRAVQRIGLSATVGNPDEILFWLSGDRGPRRLVQVPIPPREKRFSFFVEEEEEKRMDILARVVAGRKALVFVNSRSDAEKVGQSLKGRTEQLFVHHSSLSPQLRRSAENAFSMEGSACIICTSTLELGIDIGDLDVVVQVGPPGSVSSFLQRMGRSGRRGKPPYVACILRDPCEFLCMAAVIECAGKKEVEPLIPHKAPYNVLVQQILLELSRSKRVSWSRIKRVLLSSAVFHNIPPEKMDSLALFLLDGGFMVKDGDLLMPGPQAEKLYGKSNWKDLYSVIRGGGEYRVITPEGEVVGRLDARFVASRSGGGFSLGGKIWNLIKSDDSYNLAVAVPGDDQRSQVFWTGGQTGYSPVICRGVQRILARRRSLLPLSDEQEAVLSAQISCFPKIRRNTIHLWQEQGVRGYDVVILSCLGKEMNGILATLLKSLLSGKRRVKYDDFLVTVQAMKEAGSLDEVEEALLSIRGMDEEQIGKLLKVPLPDLWKFGEAIPGEMRREMAFSDHFHLGEFSDTIGSLPVKKIEKSLDPV
jgi:ATP-dependent Lhr-like helicase